MAEVPTTRRLVIIEDTAEIQCSAENAVTLRATDTVSMLRLLKTTMRLRPDRIILMDLLGTANYIRMQTFRVYEPLLAVALVYLVLTIGLVQAAARLEQRRGRRTCRPGPRPSSKRFGDSHGRVPLVLEPVLRRGRVDPHSTDRVRDGHVIRGRNSPIVMASVGATSTMTMVVSGVVLVLACVLGAHGIRSPILSAARPRFAS